MLLEVYFYIFLVFIFWANLFYFNFVFIGCLFINIACWVYFILNFKEENNFIKHFYSVILLILSFIFIKQSALLIFYFSIFLFTKKKFKYFCYNHIPHFILLIFWVGLTSFYLPSLENPKVSYLFYRFLIYFIPLIFFLWFPLCDKLKEYNDNKFRVINNFCKANIFASLITFLIFAENSSYFFLFVPSLVILAGNFYSSALRFYYKKISRFVNKLIKVFILVIIILLFKNYYEDNPFYNFYVIITSIFILIIALLTKEIDKNMFFKFFSILFVALLLKFNSYYNNQYQDILRLKNVMGDIKSNELILVDSSVPYRLIFLTEREVFFKDKKQFYKTKNIFLISSNKQKPLPKEYKWKKYQSFTYQNKKFIILKGMFLKKI